MKTIRFSNNYPKLWGQKEAILVAVRLIGESTVLHKDLIEYDTKDCKGEYYKLSKTDLIQLVFLGDKKIPFCTIRKYTLEKWQYYYHLINEPFRIEVKEKKE